MTIAGCRLGFSEHADRFCGLSLSKSAKLAFDKLRAHALDKLGAHAFGRLRVHDPPRGRASHAERQEAG